jgi:hypothetical protein
MRHAHLASGGRYPVLRSFAIMCLVAAVVSLGYGVWRAADTLFRAPDHMEGRLVVAVGWLAAAFFGAVLLFGLGEVVKLFMDIEHNTRLAAERQGVAAMAAANAAADAAVLAAAADSNGKPLGGRMTFLDGEETAEGALIRGH